MTHYTKPNKVKKITYFLQQKIFKLEDNGMTFSKKKKATEYSILTKISFKNNVKR